MIIVVYSSVNLLQLATVIGIPHTADAKLADSAVLVSFAFRLQDMEYAMRFAVPVTTSLDGDDDNESEQHETKSKFQALSELMDDKKTRLFVLFGDQVRKKAAFSTPPTMSQVCNELLVLSQDESFKKDEVQNAFAAMLFTFFEREQFIHARSGVPLSRINGDAMKIVSLCDLRPETKLAPECRFIHSTMPNAPTSISIKLLVRLYGCSHSEYAPFLWTVPNSLFVSSIVATPDYKQLDAHIKELLSRFFPEPNTPFVQLLSPQSWVYVSKCFSSSTDASLHEIFTGLSKFSVTDTHIVLTIAINPQLASYLAAKTLKVATTAFKGVGREKPSPQKIKLTKHNDIVSFLGHAMETYKEELYEESNEQTPQKIYFFDLQSTKNSMDCFLFSLEKFKFTFLAVANWLHFFPTANKSDAIEQSPFFPGSSRFQDLLHSGWISKRSSDQSLPQIDAEWLTLYRSDKVTNMLYPAALLPFGFELCDPDYQCISVPTVFE